MSCIKKGQIWKNKIGNDHEFEVVSVHDNGWVNGHRVKDDGKGKKVEVKGTAFMAHHDTMVLTMEKVG